MEELAYLLVNYLDDARLCEKLLNDFSAKMGTHNDWKGSKQTTMLYYFLDEAQEGGKAFLEKRKPDFKKYPKLP